jgi:hypothetical protein
MRQRDGHRPKPHQTQIGMAVERYRRVQDVAADFAVDLGDERDDRMRLRAQRVDQVGFGVSAERIRVQRAHACAVTGVLLTHDHRRLAGTPTT